MRRRLALPLAAGLLLAAASAAAAQDRQSSPAFLQGTEAFRRILFDTGKDLFPNGVQPLQSFNDLNDPKHTLLIVFGDAGRLTEVPGELKAFVDQGGALWLATDKAPPGRAASELEETTGVRVTGESIVCDDSVACYHKLNYCPFLRPEEGTNPAILRGLAPAGSAVSTVASNAPSCLEQMVQVIPAQGGVGFLAPQPLAWLPPKSRPEQQRFRRDDEPLLFAVGGPVGAGRVLVLADHSIFINEMMLQQDNGNVEFTYNCLNWLLGDPQEQRSKILFVEDGVVNTRFEVPIKDVPDEFADRFLDFLFRHLPEAAKAAAPALERDIQAADQHNGFNRRFLRGLREAGVSPNGFLQFLIVLLAVAVVLYGCWKIGWKARHRADLQGPLLASALHRLAPSGGAVEQRQKAQVRGGNLWESARDLARQCLADAGATPTQAPGVAVQGGWLRRWTMAGRVKRLWRLAYGPPVRVPLGEWRRLLRETQELKAALADGTVRFS